MPCSVSYCPERRRSFHTGGWFKSPWQTTRSRSETVFAYLLAYDCADGRAAEVAGAYMPEVMATNRAARSKSALVELEGTYSGKRVSQLAGWLAFRCQEAAWGSLF